MKKLLFALALAVAPTVGVGVATARPIVQQNKGWQLAAKCGSYAQACRMADKLEDKGYCTKVTKDSSGCWCVWCK